MDPIIGQIIQVPWGWQMEGWLPCAGQILQINQNQALYSLLGMAYGGDGHTTFALPDLRPIENGQRRPWHSSGELVSHIALTGIYPMRS
jgi:microcystin-dependent protein